jgi:hypothetical protein
VQSNGEWDKIPKSEKVDHQKVSFKSAAWH